MTGWDIVKDEARKAGVAIEVLRGPGRTRNLVRARMAAASRMREERDLPWGVVGRLLNRSNWQIKYYTSPEWRAQRQSTMRSKKRRQREMQ